MAIVNGIGISEWTSEKQQLFYGLLTTHLRISWAVMQKHHWADNEAYYYFDLNAGSGQYEDENGQAITGSPLLFLRAAEELVVPFQAFFFEIEPSNCDKLSSICGYRHNVRIVPGDHSDTVPRFFNIPASPQKMGMIYTDPTGDLPPFDLLARMSRRQVFKRMDIVIAIAVTNAIKRPARYGRKRLEEYLATIAKKMWIVREPCKKQQWTMLLGSNWVDYPAWESEGFYAITSKQGREIMHRLNYTADELKKKLQIPLPLTELMPNTSDIPSTGPSGQ